MAEYGSAAGFIQFPVNEKEVNGQDIREFVIRAVGSQKMIKITLWPEWEDVVVDEGDFVAVDGKYEVSLGQGRDGSQREFVQITPYKIVVTKGETRKENERKVVQKAARSTDEPLF